MGLAWPTYRRVPSPLPSRTSSLDLTSARAVRTSPQPQRIRITLVAEQRRAGRRSATSKGPRLDRSVLVTGRSNTTQQTVTRKQGKK